MPARAIRLHLFFRKPRSTETYSIERLFNAVINELPPEQFIVRRFVCPFHSRGLVRRVLLMFWAAAHQGDINHVTGDVDFLCLLMNRPRTLLTIHDAATLHRLTGWRRYVYTMFWIRLPVARAGHVTTISEFTRSEVQSALGAAKRQISVIPNCVPMSMKPRSNPFNLDLPRILHVGTKPNKNLERVVAAISGIRCVLVIIGKLSDTQRGLLQRYRVVYEAHVGISDDELHAHYGAADVVVFASTYEGFGLPILEAQTAGLPVVTSDREPMRSVAGRGAVLVDPTDIEAIRHGVAAVINEAPLRSRVVDEGFRNVASYQPAQVAAQYASIYAAMRKGEPS